MDFRNKKILIYGLGISGRGLAKLLKNVTADLVLYDDRTSLNRDEILNELGLDEKTKIILEKLDPEDLKGIDVVAISPGVSVNAPNIQIAADLGIKILGELEIAYELSKGRLVAITGTNGKTTTTALVGEIMKAAFDEVFVVGNIGVSYASVALDTTSDSMTVAEVSSFQLESIMDFHPEISAVLNITPDHLDRHGTFENYAACKMKIAVNQTENEKCIINYDDRYLRELSLGITAEPICFSRLEKLAKGVFLDGDMIMYSDGKETVPVMNKKDMNLMGDHNVENVMAAIAICVNAGVNLKTIADVIRDFKAVEHRIEYVRTVNGIDFYNDSKGTNTDAASKAVESMVVPTVLIAGGYDKGADFTEWIQNFNGRVKAMVLIGATAQKIALTAEKTGFTQVYMAGNLEKAVDMAYHIADAGECVLLSPACASWDQFKSYEERGRIFKDLVNSL